MKVGICSDHRGLELKRDLIKYLKSLNVEVVINFSQEKTLINL